MTFASLGAGAVPGPPLRVLLVDDDPDHVLLVRRALRDLMSGEFVAAIPDGGAALDALRSGAELPDLILLDVNMPGYSGFDVLTQLRADERLMSIPVVMLTSSDSQRDIARAYELGASGYVTKLAHPQDLRAVLANTLLYWSVMRRTRPGRDASTAGGPSHRG